MTTLRVKIPLEKSSIVMGMQGETIQEIRWKSKARIDFETDPIGSKAFSLFWLIKSLRKPFDLYTKSRRHCQCNQLQT